MGKINLLSSKIYNRISAGEVVERPFSVIKELVENSIDAGAKNIQIEIVSGGIDSIKVSDDGCGIERDDLKKALLPHATSKISKLADLDNILSLGFRGEALASIASVSKIKIQSKPQNQEFGAEIYAEGGDIEKEQDSALSNGTIITVDNLFYNTPAREKFLRSNRSEEGEISAMVARFILGNPDISFKYFADGKVIFQSFGDGFESAMIQVYGLDTIKNCFYIETEKNGIVIKGYISKHNFLKGNRSYQTTFLNGRYIQNQTISSAILNAYSAYTMKRQYPFYVLSINVPSEIVDVNVHPNKLDVRFANNQIIYGSVYSVISKVLDGSGEALSIIVQNNKESEINTSKNESDYATHNNAESFKFDKVLFSDIEPKKKEEQNVDIFAENKAYLESLEKKSANIAQNASINTLPIVKSTVQTEIAIKKQLKYLGQVLNTFLIFEDYFSMYFVDQHAAHERILYDKIIQSFLDKNIEQQPLLLPLVLNVNSVESEFLLNNLQTLNDMGIEIVDFGRNTFNISSIPVFLTEIDLDKFFKNVLSDINSFNELKTTDLLKEKFAQKACKSAIKSGDVLSEYDIKIIQNAVENDMGLKCPHGRPVVIKIDRMEIDKWFKRIV